MSDEHFPGGTRKQTFEAWGADRYAKWRVRHRWKKAFIKLSLAVGLGFTAVVLIHLVAPNVF